MSPKTRTDKLHVGDSEASHRSWTNLWPRHDLPIFSTTCRGLKSASKREWEITQILVFEVTRTLPLKL